MRYFSATSATFPWAIDDTNLCPHQIRSERVIYVLKCNHPHISALQVPSAKIPCGGMSCLFNGDANEPSRFDGVYGSLTGAKCQNSMQRPSVFTSLSSPCCARSAETIRRSKAPKASFKLSLNRRSDLVPGFKRLNSLDNWAAHLHILDHGAENECIVTTRLPECLKMRLDDERGKAMDEEEDKLLHWVFDPPSTVQKP